MYKKLALSESFFNLTVH